MNELNGIAIRKISAADAEGFWSTLANVAAEKKYLATVTPPPFERMQKFVLNNIHNNHAQYVALDSTNVVGWADIVPLSREGMQHVGTLGMGVRSEYRGKGIGNILLTRTIKHAWEKGLKRLELEVFSDNTCAINLYKKHGYIKEGIKRNARYQNGYYQDLVIMAQCRM